jgi:pilus assembly protein Flp/PilA
MRALIAHFLRDDSGATAIEYGLFVAGIADAIIVVVKALAPAEYNFY